jgi:predicted nucleotidyltransferase
MNHLKPISKILKDRGHEGFKIVLMGYVGSMSHNTQIDRKHKCFSDDIDVMGVMVQDPKYYIGLHKREHIVVHEGEYDIVLYDIKKFVSLLLKSNPNVLGLLFLSDLHYLVKEYAGEKLIKNRDYFLSNQCFKSFSGYAYSQLMKMQRGVFEGYMGERRKMMCTEFGYDVKNASHLIRLLSMGTELMLEGALNVDRGGRDNQKLIAIKKGEWSLEQVQDESERLRKNFEDSRVKSVLRNKPDKDFIEHLLVTILYAHIFND